MINLLLGRHGVQPGGHGGVCRFQPARASAEPLLCVNFESDGRRNYMQAKGSVRTADAREAAEWVTYCNDPSNVERRAHGLEPPLGIKYWQIGNETSYDRNGFNLETAAKKTVEFAKAMRQADPAIQLIAWGDSGWAARMAEVAGEHVPVPCISSHVRSRRRQRTCITRRDFTVATPRPRGANSWRRGPSTTAKIRPGHRKTGSQPAAAGHDGVSLCHSRPQSV